MSAPGTELQEVLIKNCRRCGAEFRTTSRIKKRCDPCQAVVERNAKQKSQRRRRRR